MIELEGIAKTYWLGGRPVHALVDVDETIRDGEHVAIVGPSGSGKSTLLNVIGCLDVPTAGSYRLDGREVGKLDEAELSRLRRESIGFVFQMQHLVPRLTALQNVELPLMLAGVDPGQRAERARRALDEVGLSPRSGHRPAELSGGERQRVVLARAVVTEPRILLADEPTGSLDQATGRQVLELLEGLRRADRTLLVVTHDPVVAGRAGRILVIVDGRIAHRLSGSEAHRLPALLGKRTVPA